MSRDRRLVQIVSARRTRVARDTTRLDEPIDIAVGAAVSSYCGGEEPWVFLSLIDLRGAMEQEIRLPRSEALRLVEQILDRAGTELTEVGPVAVVEAREEP